MLKPPDVENDALKVEIWKTKTERQIKACELRLHRIEIDLKRREASKSWIRNNPVLVAVITGFISVLVAIITGFSSILGSSWLESVNRKREIEAESLNRKHQVDMEERKFEKSLILDAINVEDPDERLVRIRFLTENDLVTGDLKTKLTPKLESESGEGLPGPPDQGISVSSKRSIKEVWIGAEPNVDMSAIRKYQLETLGWSDVGFHYFIKTDGTRVSGRSVDKPSAFVLGHNRRAIAIALACTSWKKAGRNRPESTEKCQITEKQKTETAKLLSEIFKEHKLNIDAVGKRSDVRPMSDLLGDSVDKIKDILKKPRKLKRQDSAGM